MASHKRQRTVSFGQAGSQATVVAAQTSAKVYSKADIRKIARNAIQNVKDLKHKCIAAQTADTNSGELMGVCLTGKIARGDATGDRETDKIKLIRFRASLFLAESGLYANNGDWNKQFRVLVVRKNGDDTGVNSDVWQSNPFTMTSMSQAGNTYYQIDGVLDHEKVKVIYDKVFTLDPPYGYGSTFVSGEPTTTTRCLSSKLVNIDVKLGFNQVYQTDSNNAVLGQLWLLVIPYSHSGSTNMVDLSVSTDLQFTQF